MRLVRLNELMTPPAYGGFSNFVLYVYNGEGNIPHAHLLRHGENRNTNKICICLHSDTYFHNEKLKTNDRRSRGLSGDERYELLLYMISAPVDSKSSPPDNNYKNRWEQLCGDWNAMNPRYAFTRPSVMPHYDLMKTPTDEADEILKKLRIRNDS